MRMATDRIKLNKWAEQLLDIGKRNNLINFRDTRLSSVEIVYPDVESVFEKATGNTLFHVIAPEADMDTQVNLDNGTHGDQSVTASSKHEEYVKKYAVKAKKKTDILVYNKAGRHSEALKSIRKKSKSIVDETGINVTHLAFGFVRWNETKSKEVYYNAPLLLIPVVVEQESIASPYSIKSMGDKIILNPTFSYKLREEYGITLPNYEDEGVSEYLAKVENQIKTLNWSTVILFS